MQTLANIRAWGSAGRKQKHCRARGGASLPGGFTAPSCSISSKLLSEVKQSVFVKKPKDIFVKRPVL